MNVPAGVESDFKAHLERLLYQENDPFDNGPDLKLVYGFVQFEPGNQFARWILKGIGNAGEGSLTLEAKYFDPKGR